MLLLLPFSGVQGLQPGGVSGGEAEHTLDALDACQRNSGRSSSRAEDALHVPGSPVRSPRAADRTEEGGDALLPQ